MIQVVVTLSEANCHRFSDLEGPDVAKTEQKAEWPETPEVAMEPFWTQPGEQPQVSAALQ